MFWLRHFRQVSTLTFCKGLPVAARILIADDNELGRIAIKFLLRERTDLEISAEASDGT